MDNVWRVGPLGQAKGIERKKVINSNFIQTFDLQDAVELLFLQS